VRQAVGYDYFYQQGQQLQDEELWQFLFGLQRQWQQRGGEMSNLTIDEMIMEEGLTPELLIESGREWREFLLASMTPEERLAGLSEVDLLRLIEGDEQIRKQIIANAPPEERLAGMAPEERLAGMAPEELTILLEQIEHYLHQPKTPPKPKEQK